MFADSSHATEEKLIEESVTSCPTCCQKISLVISNLHFYLLLLYRLASWSHSGFV